MSEPLLSVAGLTKRFGGVVALDDVSFDVRPGEFVGVIGPNGSGKSTLLNCLTGALLPDQGRVAIDGVEATGWAPFKVARAGLACSFQGLEDFPHLTVRDHLLLAVQWRRPAYRRTARHPGIGEVLEAVGLSGSEDRLAGHLSYGQRKLLGIAMALMQQPRAMLLDEPTAGVSPPLVELIGDRLTALRAAGHTILLVEHNIPLVTSVASRLVVLSSGRKIADGDPAAVIRQPDVVEAYFGG